MKRRNLEMELHSAISAPKEAFSRGPLNNKSVDGNIYTCRDFEYNKYTCETSFL